jgi:hypothetical protein
MCLPGVDRNEPETGYLRTSLEDFDKLKNAFAGRGQRRLVAQELLLVVERSEARRILREGDCVGQ